VNVHVLQHAPFEDIGSIAGWLDRRQVNISYTRLWEPCRFPDPSSVDLLIAMGGPMSVNDETALPWLRPEKAFVRDVIERRIPTLGVCLGAQLIASALGGRVYPNRDKEIGWFEVEATADGSLLGLPATLDVFHWHGETFDLPAGAVRLARSRACQNQAFSLGHHVIALQFHLEATPSGVGELIANCADELVAAPYVQSADRMRATPDVTFQRTNRLMDQILDALAGGELGAEHRSTLRREVDALARRSPAFDWVGIYLLRGDSLILGPYVGAATEHSRIRIGVGVCGTAVAENRDINVPDVRAVENYLACSLSTRSELVVLIRDRRGRIVGQIDLDSHTPAAFGPDEEAVVRDLARELGENWPT
jgi:GMP synthase-like glutamine amidotransferase/putative methionine-R-sulfoxide reductase with GAF domain